MLDSAAGRDISLFFQLPLHVLHPIPQRTVVKAKSVGLDQFHHLSRGVGSAASGRSTKQTKKQRRSLCGDLLIEHEG